MFPRQSQPMDLDGDDCEWEWDYEDADVYYVTLDLTIPNPNDMTASDKDREEESLPPSRKARSKLSGQPPLQQQQQQQQQESRNQSSSVSRGSAAAVGKIDSRHRQDKIQFLSLDSENPLVSYQNKIYSCQWTQPVGTEMVIACQDDSPSTSSNRNSQTPGPTPKVPTAPSSHYAKLYSLNHYRLRGLPALLTPREALEDHRHCRLAKPPIPRAPNITPQGTRIRNLNQGQTVAQGASGSGARTAFWARLEDIQREKGEYERIIGIEGEEVDLREIEKEVEGEIAEEDEEDEDEIEEGFEVDEDGKEITKERDLIDIDKGEVPIDPALMGEGRET